MKTLEELAALREKMRNKVAMREGAATTRVVVGMATCGISAGARPILNTFVEEINREGLFEKVTVTQTGCIGICQYEPIVEIYDTDGEKITYVKMTSEKVKRVVKEHLQNGNVVTEYTIGSTKA